MAGNRNSTAKCLLKRSGEFAHAFFCHLPLVVVGAVTWAASRLLLAAYIQAKVLYTVVGLVSVHMIDALFGCKRSAKVSSHDKAVFHDRLLAALHGSEVFDPLVRNGAYVNENVACAGKFLVGAVSPVHPLVLTGLQFSPAAFAAKALEVVALHFNANLTGRALTGASAAGARHINKDFALSIQTAKAHFLAYRRMFDWGVVRNASHVYLPFY